ncbi:leucyl aminopeptidase family protein [Piscirickettsia salmonis]|uniref:leucyl aminopeptidase family protein n=1 Tax=Piscirickettsia salmonis TaxID=1238 RepID=UPI00137B93E7|nr:leucyl aminopeptidase family protein [Piscirickettsia salmonis]QHS28475.1 leucyl aminopeptidase family protein [Piscirickettsia salmonis]
MYKNSVIIADAEKTTAINAVIKDDFGAWLEGQSAFTQNWLKSSGFKADVGQFQLLSDEAGQLFQVVLIIANESDFWSFGNLSRLPQGQYMLSALPVNEEQAAVAFALGSYCFDRYKESKKTGPELVIGDALVFQAVNRQVNALCLGRDLINTPAEDMGPQDMADTVKGLAKEFNADFKEIVGDELITEDYPAIHAVGRASDRAPRLLELNWGDKADKKVTLVGKGVCFDSGGLDIKPSSGMLFMKKDMGGAAHAIALAHWIMAAKLNISLRLLIPAVDNAIAGNAYRPGDVIATRKGISVEIKNTDAEGRVVLGDALALAAEAQPELVIDFATLTGAARVALGTELPACFTNQRKIETALRKLGEDLADPVWPMPLFKAYRSKIDSQIADLSNCDLGGYGGAITAALYLEEFVGDCPWIHFDVMGYNNRSLPGRPEGGEIMGVRTVFSYLEQQYTRVSG